MIDTGTDIRTDAVITRNGETGVGAIYRGPEQDGLPSIFFYGATSAFDVASGFDLHFGAPENLPIAALKFDSLQLAGNPTISQVNGGAPNLALIRVRDLTAGPSAGTLTFSGIQQLLLATENGSITLGSDVTFQDIPALYFYARGPESDLVLSSAITGVGDLTLLAERDIRVV